MKTMKLACAAAIALGTTVTMSSAQIAAYAQNFESMDPMGETVLADDGWGVGANVWDEFYFSYLYGYFVFPAPNSNDGLGNGDRFSSLATGEGGPDQGNNVLVTFSDYNNADHALGYYIEANFYREYTVTTENIGETWTFSFDAKAGNIEDNLDPTAFAQAFIKTLNPPANGGNYDLINFVTVDTNGIDPTWQRYQVELTIDETMVGYLFQVGFLNLCTLYESSGVFYDNIDLSNGSVACLADLNGDGILDNGDIGTFVGLFLAGC